MITVAIAEDHQALIDGMDLLLQFEDGIKIVGTANDGDSLWEIVKKVQPNVVITDIKMPKMDGIVVTKLIKNHFPAIKVIGFSMFEEPEAVKQMVQAGASGYLSKSSPLEQIIAAINTVMEGGSYFDPLLHIDNASQPQTANIQSVLTKSEQQILKLIGEGKTTSEIAALRFTAVSTVEKHRKNMLYKLNLSGKGELLRYAIEKKYNF